MDGNQIRHVLLGIIEENRGGYLQQGPILNEAVKRLGIKGNIDLEQLLLTKWNDLFRSGHLGWGYDLLNPAPPFFHITEKGRETFKKLSRDPANPQGYIDYLSRFNVNSIADSYIREALETYNNNCFKASAVMIGAAAESIILELRDNLVNKMNELGKSVPDKLKDWKIKTVIDQISEEIELKKEEIPRPLFDAFSAYWSALSGQIRFSRNDAGHPSSIEPVTEGSVHASLLIFPELVKLVSDLIKWISDSYT